MNRYLELSNDTILKIHDTDRNHSFDQPFQWKTRISTLQLVFCKFFGIRF